MSHPLTCRSAIKYSLKRSYLIRGTCLAGVGLAILLFPTLFIDAATLSYWGFLLFCLAFLLIFLGLTPYRKLMRLELFPYLLQVDESEMLFFATHTGKKFAIPCKAIKKTAYKEGETLYGICMWLDKKQLQEGKEKILVLDPLFDMLHFQENAKKEHGCDLFFPFFTKRSYDLVNETIKRDLIEQYHADE